MGTLEDISGLGGNPAYLLAALVFLIMGNTLKFWQLLAALILLYAVVVPIRYFFFHERPKPMKYHNFVEKFVANTLISIHTARATILACTLIAVFRSWQTGILFGALIPLVGTSRIMLQKHRPIDVATGALVGGLIAIAVLNIF